MGRGGVQMTEYKVDLRWDDGAELTDQTKTTNVDVALEAYRALLAKPLGGQSVAARFVVDGRSLYFSRFNRPYGQKFGRSRIHPKAPLDPDLHPQNDLEQIEAIMAWTPSGDKVTPFVGRNRNAAGADVSVLKDSSALLVEWLGPFARSHSAEYEALINRVADDCVRRLQAAQGEAQREAILAAHGVLEGLRKAAAS